MTLRFYYTHKRINALTQPDVDEGQAVITTFTDFYLKDETSLNNPVFVIVAGNLPETNYCILSDTGATAERPAKYYYFVNEIVQVRKTVWHINCTIDALATWKQYILTQSAFVVRSASRYSPYLNDDTMQSDGSFPQRNVLGFINDDFSGVNGGTFILALAATGDSSANNSGLGGMTYYACTAAGTRYICETLFQTGVAQQIAQSFGNLASAFGGMWWIPLKIENVIGTWISSIYIGGQTLTNFGTGNVGRINKHYYDFYNTFQCNLMHFGDFRDLPPYRKYYAKLPFVGVVDIDDATMCERNRQGGGSVSIQVRELIDFITGIFTIRLSVDSYHLGTFTASCKVDLPLVSFNTNLAGMIAGGIGVAGGIMQRQSSNRAGRMKLVDPVTDLKEWAKGLWQKGLDRAMSYGVGLDSIDQHIGGTYSIMGGYGGTMTVAADPELRIYERYQNTAADPASVAPIAGRPLGAVARLGDLSGYCLTSGFCCGGRMTSEEKFIIEEAFNGRGVYLTE